MESVEHDVAGSGITPIENGGTRFRRPMESQPVESALDDGEPQVAACPVVIGPLLGEQTGDVVTGGGGQERQVDPVSTRSLQIDRMDPGLNRSHGAGEGSLVVDGEIVEETAAEDVGRHVGESSSVDPIHHQEGRSEQ